LTVTARSGLALGNTTTVNYAGSYVKLTNGTLTPATQAARYARFDALGGGNTPALSFSTGFPAPASDPAISFTAGVGTLSFGSGPSGEGFQFDRSPTTPNAPFDADIVLTINVIDADGITGGAVSIGSATAGGGMSFAGGKDMRFGRLRILNATGVASRTLDIPIRTEYWNGTGFTLNTSDSCTTLDRANITLGNYAKSLNACETAVTTATVTFASGLGTLKLSKPNAGNEGSVNLIPQLGATASGDFCAASPGAEAPSTAADKTFLRGAWGGTTYDKNPSGRASFGTYGAQPRNFIFFREN
jgi:hypothetical protein